MKYEHIFRKMPQAWLDSISEQSWCRSLLRQGEKLSILLTDKNHLVFLLRRLTTAEINSLRLILSAFGCEPFTKEALDKQAALHMAGAQLAVGLIGLRKYGVIAAFRKAWGEQLFVLPEDGFGAWQELLFPDIHIRKHSGSEELEPIDLTGTSARGLAQLFFHFLAACSQQPGLPLTGKGTLHKKQLQKLSEHLVLPQQTLQATGLSYAFRDVYTGDTAILLEMAIRLGILIHAEDRYQLDQKALFNWLRRSYEEQQAMLYEIWRQLFLPAPAWLQHSISLMERISGDDWSSLEDIAAWIDRYCILGYPSDKSFVRNELVEQWVKPLCAFRWLELAADSHGTTWFRYLIPILDGSLRPKRDEAFFVETEGGAASELAAERTLYVQPDFELLLPPNVSLYTEWQITAFADLQSSDFVRTYRINKESCNRASEIGFNSEAILQFLEKHAVYDIPEHVRMTLQQWERQSGKLQLEEITLLRCESTEVAETLLRNEKCSAYLQQRIGDSYFMIQREQISALRKCLEQMGYHPRIVGNDMKPKGKTSIEQQMDASERNAAPAKMQGLFYSRDAIQLYDIDTTLPEWDDLYPDMKDIPSLWLKEFRDYHGSTRKEMIRKAIEWKSCLQLRKDGQNRLIIPRAIYEERSGWTLIGTEEHREISLKSEDWEEMKLILPGINDVEKEETL